MRSLDQEVAGGIERRRAAEGRHGLSAPVHEGLRFDQDDAVPPKGPLGRERGAAATELGQTPLLPQNVGQEKPGVVARDRVLRARVAERDDGAQGLVLFRVLFRSLGLRLADELGLGRLFLDDLRDRLHLDPRRHDRADGDRWIGEDLRVLDRDVAHVK